MSSRIVGPFPRLQGLDPVNADDPLDLLERCDLINAVLAEAKLCCNGYAQGHQRDEYWGADLSELVIRCAPHRINGESFPVNIRIETLQAVVDDNNEIMGWKYAEGSD